MQVSISETEKLELIQGFNVKMIEAVVKAHPYTNEKTLEQLNLLKEKINSKPIEYCPVIINMLKTCSFSLDFILLCLKFIIDICTTYNKTEPFNKEYMLLFTICFEVIKTLKNDFIMKDFLSYYVPLNQTNHYMHSFIGEKYSKENNFDLAYNHLLMACSLEQSETSYLNLMIFLFKSKKDLLCIEVGKKCIEKFPTNHSFHNNVSISLLNLKRYDESLIYALKALEFCPNNNIQKSIMHSNLSICYDRIMYYEQSYREIDIAISLNPKNKSPVFSKLMNDLYKEVSYENRFYHINNHKNAVKLLEKTKNYTFQAFDDEMTNIGIISGDFILNHPVYFFMRTFLENYNKKLFNVKLYSTKNYNINFENLVDVSNMENDDISDLIYNDRIQILIDLSGVSSGHKLEVLKNKPAPVQITYCGYPATTGLEEIDYRISDEICEVDTKISQDYHTEKLLLMKNCFLCYSYYSFPEIEENIPGDFLILSCYNKINKISKTTLDLFDKILKRFKNVKIAFNSSGFRYEELRNKLLSNFSKKLQKRIFFIDSNNLSTTDHMKTYNQVNIHIDTTPYSGTTTTCEALSMGVPTLTVYDTEKCFHVTNVTTSILKNSDLDFYVCDSQENLMDKIEFLLNKPKEYWNDFKQTVRNKFFNGYVCNKDLYLKNFTDLLLETVDKNKEKLFEKYINKFTNPVYSPTNLEDLCCVIVEPRNHPYLKSVLRNISYFTKHYPIIWFHSEENKDFLHEEDFQHVIKIKLCKANLTLEDYNTYLTSPEFWKGFSHKRVLIFQTDTCMFREGIEDFLKYDYIGAPWPPGFINSLIGRDLICGNGGFSLRNPSLMVEICETKVKTLDQEDLFFSSSVYEMSETNPQIVLPKSMEEASFFSSETVLNIDTMAFHAAYKYHKITDLKKFLK